MSVINEPWIGTRAVDGSKDTVDIGGESVSRREGLRPPSPRFVANGVLMEKEVNGYCSTCKVFICVSTNKESVQVVKTPANCCKKLHLI